MPLIALLPLLGIFLAWRRIAGVTAPSAALHGAAAVMLFLYLAALAGLLLPAAIVILAGGSLLAALEIYRLARTRTALPLPFGILIALAVVFWLIHRDAAFAYYDEYAHWGIYVKDLLAGNALWDAGTNAMHLRYLPGPPLWQYLFLRAGGPLEGGAYLAQFCLLLIPLLVLFRKLEWSRTGWILGIAALIALAVSDFGHGFASLYVDHVLGAWFGGVLFNFMAELRQRSSKQLLCYVLPLTTVALLKDAGLFFAAAAAGICALMLFWRLAFDGGERRLRAGIAGAAPLLAAGLLAAALVPLSWNANRDALHIPKAAISSGGIVSGILSGETNLTPEQLQELGRRFRDVVLHQQVSKDETTAMYNAYSYEIKPLFKDRFRLTTASMLLIFALWQLAALKFFVARGDRWRWAIGTVGLLTTTLVYLVVLALAYRFAFDDRALSLSSYLRYVHTALLPLFLFALLPLLPAFAMDDAKPLKLAGDLPLSRSAAAFAIVLTAMYVVETPYLKPLIRAQEAPPIRVQLEPLARRVAEVVGKDRLWVYLPVPDSNGLVGRILRYQMAPVRTEVGVDPQLFASNPQLMSELVENWDYLWFPMPQPGLDEQLRFYFGDDLKDRLFRVDRHDDGISVVALDGVFGN